MVDRDRSGRWMDQSETTQPNLGGSYAGGIRANFISGDIRHVCSTSTGLMQFNLVLPRPMENPVKSSLIH